MSFWDDCMSPKQGVKEETNVAYPTMDGDDVVCSNCGYIIGYGDDETDPVCPCCGMRLEWQ